MEQKSSSTMYGSGGGNQYEAASVARMARPNNDFHIFLKKVEISLKKKKHCSLV